MALVMTLTRRQKHNMYTTILVSVLLCLAGTVIWLLVATWSSPGGSQANTPGPKIMNVNKYTEIDTSNDGNIDHYCVGSTGLWYEQQGPYTFAVEGSDPLCR